MATAMFRIGRTIWQIIAALLVAVAVVIAGVRFLLVDINSHNDWFEEWLARALERPVSIGELSGEWRGWSPSLQLKDLTVYESNRTNALVQFKYAHVDISITESIRSLELKPKNITLGGVEFTLARDADGNFAIAGMPPARWPVAKWVEGQRRLTLTDAKIRVVEFDRDKAPQVFEDLSLSIVRNGENRQISGATRRQASLLETWQFRIDANKSILSSDWDGNIYLRGKDIDPLLLSSNFNFDPAQMPDSSLDFTSSSKWQAAKLINAGFEAILRGGASTDNIFLKAHGVAQRLDTGWSLGIIPERVGDRSFSEDSAPIVRGRWLDNEAKFAWAVSDLAIKDLRYMIDRVLPAGSLVHRRAASLNPNGIIREALVLSTNAQLVKPLSGRMTLEALSVQESDNMPALSDLNLSVQFGAKHGKIIVAQPQDIQLSSSRWLANDLSVNDLTGAIFWSHDDSGVTTLSTTNLRTVVDSFDLRTTGSLKLSESPDHPSDETTLAGAMLNIVSYVDDGDLSQFAKLVPKNLMPEKGERWARTALHKGEIVGGAIAIRGPIQKFPFDDNDGVFRAIFKVKDLSLEYGKKWPIVEKIAGQLTMEKRFVKFDITGGQIYSSAITNSSIEIPDLFTRQRNVQITGKTKVSAEDVNRFIDESPLKNTNAKQFKNVEISDAFGLELDINLGIFPGGEKELLGQAHFKGNTIESRNLRLALKNLDGSVSFTRQDWYGEGLSATFEGSRVGVLLNGGLDDPNYDTEIRLTGTSSADFLLRQMKAYTPAIAKVFADGSDTPPMTGSASWKTVISLPSTSSEQAPAPRKINLQSSLKGLDIDLPWPLGKTREHALPFSMTLHSSDTANRVSHFNLSDRVTAKIVQPPLPEGKQAFIGADFVFANGSSTLEKIDGVTLRGQMAQFDLSEWQPVLQRFIEGTNENANRKQITSKPPIKIDLTVQNLVLLGNQFPNTKVFGKHDKEGWHLQLDGERISGDIGAPDDTALPMYLKFARLNLSKGLSPATKKAADPRHLRPISLESVTTKYGDIDLGKVSFSTERINNGIRVPHAIAEAGTFTLQGSGDWTSVDGINQSQLNISVTGDTLSGLLGGFGYAIANIEGGATQLQLDAFWPGTPTNFALEKVRGHLTLDVEAGKFLDIEPGGGRLFGLLSLQTLPRRLSLDFDDLFSKGFTFDNIDGTFSIDHGNAYTNSLLMDGPSAKIQISGRTGLKEQDYDQHVTVTPALSNSIPVASALFGPAGIGVGAVIYLGQKMFKSIPEQMDKFLSREYSITGDWSSPVIEKI